MPPKTAQTDDMAISGNEQQIDTKVKPVKRVKDPNAKRRAGIGGVIDSLAQQDIEQGYFAQPKVSYEEWRGRQCLKFTDDMPRRAYNEYMNAAPLQVVTKVALADRLGISEDTFYEWMKMHNLFARAIRAGEAMQEERLATAMCCTRFGNNIFSVMKNVHKWADRQETNHTVDIDEAMERQAKSAERVVWDQPTGTHARIESTIDAPIPIAPSQSMQSSIPDALVPPLTDAPVQVESEQV